MGRKKKNTVLNKKSTKEKEVVEQEVHIKEISEQEETPENNGDLSGLENDEQPQYLLPEKEIKIVPNEELKTESIKEIPEEIEEIVKEVDETKPRDLKSLSKAELRFYQRTGMMPK